MYIHDLVVFLMIFSLLMSLVCILIQQIQMDVAQYKHFLVKIKQEFQTKLASQKSNTLPVEQVSKILYRHTHEQPLMLRDFLLKGTGKLQITWDELLQYLQQQISIHEEVKKIQHCPISSTEIVENHFNEFGRLVQYIKKKETNMVQVIKALPVEVGGKDLYLVCMDKELVIFDLKNREVLNSIGFVYSKMKEKVFEKEELRRIQKEKLSQAQAEEYLDKVDANKLSSQTQDVKKSSLGRFLTSNIRNSRRGSALSSDNSDKMMFRKQTESGEAKKRTKSSVIKVKNDDISKIFQIFENATVTNSITVAKAFTEARSNFHKHIILDKSVLEKEKVEKNYQMLSILNEHNYQGEVSKMRSTSLDLNNIRKVLKKGQRRLLQAKNVPCIKTDNFTDQLPLKEKKSSNMQAVNKQKSILQIVRISVFQQFLLVSLFNREIRLLHLKKGLATISEEIIFQKQFKTVVTFLELYKSANGQYRFLAVLDKGGKSHSQDMQKSTSQAQDSGVSQLKVFYLNQQMQIKSKPFQCELNFSAKYQPAFPFGVVLFNQKGNFALFQLNSTDGKSEQKVICDTALFNSVSNYRVSINEVRVHRNMTNFYLCCSNGFVYLFDRLAKKIKYLVKVSSSPVIDLHLIRQDTEIIVLSSNGNMAILSTLHLERIFLYQSYHEVSLESKILSADENKFYIYTCRSISSYMIYENEEKQFTNMKPLKIMKNRMKLKGRSSQHLVHKERNKVYKVVEGKGGKGDFVCLILEQGELCFIGSSLNYIGSYHSLKINNIVDITCNQSYQFISILFDDNTLQIANLYTQRVLFTVALPEKEKGSRNESVNSSKVEKNRPIKSKLKESILLTNFFSPEKSSLFLAVITQRSNVYHFQSKGSITACTNLQQICGDFISNIPMIYIGEQLILLTGGSITVLHRHSYFKKCVINVCAAPLLQAKRHQSETYPKLVCIDENCTVYLVDIDKRKVKYIFGLQQTLRQQRQLFNKSFVAKIGKSLCKVKLASERQKIVRVDSSLYYYAIVGEHLVQISKASGRLYRLDYGLQLFQQFYI